MLLFSESDNVCKERNTKQIKLCARIYYNFHVFLIIFEFINLKNLKIFKNV